MSIETVTKQHYVNLYEQSKDQLIGDQAWLKKQRENAILHFEKNGFPTRKNESWKYTSLYALSQSEYALSTEYKTNLARERVQQHALAIDSYCLVIVDGFYQEALSSITGLPDGVVVTSLRQAIAEDHPLLEKHLADQATQDSIDALNTAFLNDGSVIEIEKNTTLDKPIQLIFISSHSESAHAVKNIIAVGEGSRVNIIENYIGLEDMAYFTNSRSEIHLAANATVTHYKCQQDSALGNHISAITIHQEQNSTANCYSFSLGGKLVRSDTTVNLNAEGATCQLNGLYIGKNADHIDHHTQVNHAKPNTHSQETYKGIMTDQSHAVFDGKIWVAPNAQKTQAQLSNKNLLLSRQAQVDTKPQLEIFADDVKCSHGATVGQLDSDQLFYLRSRGINSNAAKQLLLEAFAKEVVSQIENDMIKVAIQKRVENVLQTLAA